MSARIGPVLSGAALLLIAAAPPSPAVRQIEAQANDRERARAEALEEAEAAKGEIAGLNAQLAEFDRAQAAGERTVSGKRLRLAALNAQEAEMEQELGGERAELARLLAVLEIFRRDRPPALLVSPRDIKDAVRAAILVRAITPELTARADQLRAEIDALHATRRQAALASEDLFVTESDIAQRRARIETLIAQKTALEQSAETQAAKAGQDLQALNTRLRALNDLARGAPSAPNAPPPPDPEHAGLFGRPKLFLSPVAGAPVALFNAPEPGGGRSGGWSWRPAPGTAVVAPADGVVDYVGALKGWGVVVILRLGGGYHLVVAGMDESQAQFGHLAKAGEAIGRMAATGPPQELYLEVRKNGAPIDPALWIKR
jgi:septal ring factor EnvC (AmiA/AmiB activator)